MSRSVLTLDNRLALRPKEAAEALGICDKTLRQWMRDEGLPYFHVGRGIFIPLQEFERWMSNRLESQRTTDDIVEEILNDL